MGHVQQLTTEEFRDGLEECLKEGSGVAFEGQREEKKQRETALQEYKKSNFLLHKIK